MSQVSSSVSRRGTISDFTSMFRTTQYSKLIDNLNYHLYKFRPLASMFIQKVCNIDQVESQCMQLLVLDTD